MQSLRDVSVAVEEGQAIDIELLAFQAELTYISALDLVEKIKPLMAKAFEYIKNTAIDIEKECGYHEWSPELTERVNNYINMVAEMKSPTIELNSVANPVATSTQPTQTPASESVETDQDDLPF